MKKKKEVKKITLGLILGWIFGIIFILAGLGALTSSQILQAIIMFVMAGAIFPPITKLIKEKMNIELSKGLKIVIIIVGFIIIGVISTSNVNDDVKITEQNTINNLETQKQEVVETTQKVVQKSNKYYLGEKVEMDEFSYIVNSYYTTEAIGQNLMGTFMGEKADGIFLVVDVTIENIAKESKHIFASNIQIVDDKDRTFDHDSTAEFYLQDDQGFNFEQMQPGLPKTGKIVFDVPKDGNLKLKISSDSLFSDEFKYVLLEEK